MANTAVEFLKSTRLVTGLALTVGFAAACSLQQFDYLQDGVAEAGRGGSSSGSGGSDESGASGGPSFGGASGSGTSGSGTSGSGTSGAGTSGAATAGDAGQGGDGTGGTSGGTGGSGATGQVVNPSFETSNTSGWTVDPPEALTSKHAYVQWPVGGSVVPDGNYELSTWHQTDAFVVEISQTVRGLDDGTYELKAYFSRGDGHNEVSLFARDCGGAEVTPVPVPLTEPTQWLAVTVPGIEVEGGSCEIGVRIDSNANQWLNADLFTLTKEE